MLVQKPSAPRGAVVALVAATAVAISACSSSTGGGADTSATRPASGQTATAGLAGNSPNEPAAPAAASGSNALHVAALDSGARMAYRITGTPHAGLVTITLQNKGKYAHEIGLARVKPGVSLAQVRRALMSSAPDAEAKAKALQVAPDTLINAPAIVGPGLTEQVTLPLVAGHYIVTCFLPGPHGMPHVGMGMIGEFTVKEPASAATPPATNGTIRVTDRGITLPASFGSGGTFAVRNVGTKVHDFSLAKLAGAPLPQYFQCVGAAFGKGTPIDNCPGTLQGGVTAIAPGTSTYLTIHLPTGSYGYVSTQGDGADFQAGLHGTFTVG